ncbi:exonuclease subunit SbcD [Thiospirochaeta perfilievii]|uniref:Nuclease SbcCD subunit D n=1 Tax=Thiospirochaeta perfilievii TaxID=252967 RepID=A0A5C1QC27_9SPIO|nr:exonuclease SbcCD subunit D C-terminal domain-containing protein [Thiospirochaeta perfilievii]QEN04650.1 exonuclease subunit SbcD [Thiospirochaeta perfilievii]
MRILHTSDWHLGRSLYGKQRLEEFSSFLDWLLGVIIDRKIELLLVSGDIFDTTTPGNRAQELYYQFLHRVKDSDCRNIIITAGNHDSPSFLSAPKDILKFMNIHIVPCVENIEDEVIVLYDKDGSQELIICAVPYLRDRDIRSVDTGENLDDKNKKLVMAIKDHYLEVSNYALSLKEGNTPIIAMGHLFTAGGKTLDGDGVRELYVGSLSHTGSDIFPSFLDYVALGHLHVPQKVNGLNHIRYCGSPLPMGFGEATQDKILIQVDLNGEGIKIDEIKIPKFQELIRLSGNKDFILDSIKKLKDRESHAWLEIEYKGSAFVGNLQDEILELISDSFLEVRIIKNSSLIRRVLDSSQTLEELEELTTEDVFEKCLDVYEVSKDEKPLLRKLYKRVLAEVYEEDTNI